MKANTDPLRLDVAVLAAAGGELAGQWPAARLLRLAEMAAPAGVPGADDVSWAARGEQRPRHSAPPEVWLHLSAHALVGLTCQRCLAPMEQLLEIDRPLRFVASEAEAEALDAELEEDVLELPRFLNLIELIEDEFLLALPLVPMHERCPAPLVAPGADPAEEAAPADHPFAALKGWKGPAKGH
jgi:uncharacterized protein